MLQFDIVWAEAIRSERATDAPFERTDSTYVEPLLESLHRDGKIVRDFDPDAAIDRVATDVTRTDFSSDDR